MEDGCCGLCSLGALGALGRRIFGLGGRMDGILKGQMQGKMGRLKALGRVLGVRKASAFFVEGRLRNCWKSPKLKPFVENSGILFALLGSLLYKY